MENKPKYDVSNIKTLTIVDLIRSRPGMYLGGTENCSNLILVVLDEFKRAIKNINAKHFSKISILIHENNEVELTVDNSGLSIEVVDGVSDLEKLMTEPKHYYDDGFGISGLIILNALSSKVHITTVNQGIKWTQKYQDGKPQPLKKCGKVGYSGITIRFLPDKKFFSNLHFDQTQLTTRLKELSYLHKDLSIKFEDRSIHKAHFHNPNGLEDLVLDLLPKSNNWKTKIPPVHLRDETSDFKLNAVIVFAEDFNCDVSFVNDEKTIEGGTHQKGLIAGVAQVLKIVSGCKKSVAIWKSVVQEGIISVLSIHISDTQWEGSTKDRLISKATYIKTKSLVVKNLLQLMNENEKLLYEFKKLFIDKYLMMDYTKHHDKYGLPTPQYVKEKLVELFNNPKEYDFLIEQYIEFERLHEECLKQQKLDSKMLKENPPQSPFAKGEE
jgi:DNA gyrase subunit B